MKPSAFPTGAAHTPRHNTTRILPDRPLIPIGPDHFHRSAHLVGIAGAGMRALAELLCDWGWKITGSDAQPSAHSWAALTRRGLRISNRHAAENLPPACRLVIYSAAVPENNPERAAAAQRGIEQISYPEMLGRLMNSRTGVAIAGTHGKSTVTALLGWILRSAGRDASLLCGATLCGVQSAGWGGSDQLLVAESCEYRRHFHQLRPQLATVLDIEPDHFDSFPTQSDAIAAYSDFIRQIAPAGLLVCRAGRSAINSALGCAPVRVVTFDVDGPADWVARNIIPRNGATQFRMEHRGAHAIDCTLPLPGRHNVLNALAAAALADELGIDREALAHGLQTFPGLRRRFEFLGAWKGVDLIDDYAHHPSAISAVLRTAREQFPTRRLWAVFQPHQVSRTVALQSQFAASLALADEVLVSPVYAAREQVGRQPFDVAETLARSISPLAGRARFVPSLDHVLSTLETDARPGDVVVIMGAGDIEQVRDELCRRIQRNHAS
ncbi:MAG: UDP-N-acetylmuramate--L-alanine ligase [Planctomycetota bacterium]|nr:MAG: UDP-N-acetylmuramate--L-alanine ligase [Planctomycetota bacterium]REK21823.1 MAG: UDP-N-acetylmuramate--L-alanine ligase [Planctomycetota bacterium]